MAAILLAAISARAQRIEVVDSEGHGIPYASVLTAEAEYIGTTDLDGVLADAKGAKAVTVTHVAFKSKDVTLNGKDIRVTLEDADFSLPEITVQPKPLVYVQTYYRLYVHSEKDGIVCYRAGLTDNAYDPQKKKVSASTNHVTKAKKGIIRIGMKMFGSYLDALSHISVDKMEDRLVKLGKEIGLTITNVAPDKKRISDNWGTIGYITDDKGAGLRRFSYDTQQIIMHVLKARGKDKILAKAEKMYSKRQNQTDANYTIYLIDDEGNYAPEDFVMRQSLQSFDEVKDGETDHCVYGFQVFTIERAYVTKEELKQLKKDNKMKISLTNIQQFEQQHSIPPLHPSVQKAIDGLKE